MAHLSKVNDKDQYLAASTGNKRGRTTSSYVESGNKSILPARSLHPTAAVIWLVDKIQSRFELNRAAAIACTSDLPPRVMGDLRKPKEQAAQIATGETWFTNAEKTKGTVPLLGKPHLKAKVDLTKTYLANVHSCDRGCSVVTGLPCCHQLALADAGGHDIKDFMHIAATTDGWRKQYLQQIMMTNRISGMTPSALCPHTSATVVDQARSARLGFLKIIKQEPR